MKTLFATLLFSVAAFAQGPPFPYATTLTWTPSTTTGVTAQNMYRALASPTCGVYALLPAGNKLAPTVSSFTDTTVVAGLSYCYELTALVGTSESAPDVASGNPYVIPPAPPSGLGATIAKAGSQEKATFAWTQSPTKGITSNELWCAEEPTGKMQLKAQSSKPVTQFVGDAPKGTAYCEVIALIGKSESAPSNQAKIIVP